MADLHLWIGVLAGWLLFAIFVTGAINFYRDELSQWMRPEISARPAHLDKKTVSELAISSLHSIAQPSSQWQIWLPTDRSNTVEVAWETENGRERRWLDPATGQPVQPRETQAGEFFYYFHFSLHYLPRTLGRWIVGLCALFGLVAIVTGVIVHKRIFADFFTFRWGKGQRSWLDAHNAFSVLGLPFHVMILYTGLVTLMFMYMPWGKELVFSGDRAPAELIEAMTIRAQPSSERERNPNPLNITPMLAEVSLHWSEQETHRIIVNNPDTTGREVLIARGDNQRASVSPEYLRFNGNDGKLIEHKKPLSIASNTWGLLYALHLGRFGDGVARLLYFLLSLAGAAMIATGMVLWTIKRRSKKYNADSLGNRFVEKGNIACIAGLLVALPAFLMANRLLATDLIHRAEWEIHCFFLTWLCTGIHAAFRSVSQAWREQLVAAASLFIALPLLNTFTTHRGLLNSVIHRDWIFVSFDGVCFLLGLTLILIARRIRFSSHLPGL